VRYAIGESFAVVGRFRTGRTVTGLLFNGETGASIPLTVGACVEIGATGLYRLNNSDIVTALTAKTIVVWQMTDAVSNRTDEGFVVVGTDGAGASDPLLDVWRDRGLDPAIPKLINENVIGEDYDEDVGADLHKDVIKVGSLTTITRT